MRTRLRLPKTVTVLIDSREKSTKAIEFPRTLLVPGDRGYGTHSVRISTVKKELKTGDYMLASASGKPFLAKDGRPASACERKGSVSELNTNLNSNDRQRALRAWDRMAAEIAHPFALFDFKLHECYAPKTYMKMPTLVISQMFRELALRADMPVLWLPPAAKPVRVGEMLLHYMWQHCLIEGFRTKVRKTHEETNST